MSFFLMKNQKALRKKGSLATKKAQSASSEKMGKRSDAYQDCRERKSGRSRRR